VLGKLELPSVETCYGGFMGQSKHGHTSRISISPTYHSWRNMRNRCNRNHSGYSDKGITYAPQWDDFNVFLQDMGERPEGTTLDRIDSTGNYEPSNCRWATPKEQSENSSAPRLITFNGKTLNVSEWALEVGVSRDTLSSRLRLGWSVERALTTPPNPLRRPRQLRRDAGVPQPNS
jgi:hypothetical protein